MFFMLAQAVDDPWDEQELLPGSAAKDWVWATRDEVAAKVVDQDMVRLAQKMLS